MSAEVLRRAAALMRERAEAAVLSPWEAVEGASGHWWVECPNTADIALDLHGENARHIASWHPTVALAVADWLEAEADAHSAGNFWADVSDEDVAACCRMPPALAVARAYLGEQS